MVFLEILGTDFVHKDGQEHIALQNCAQLDKNLKTFPNIQTSFHLCRHILQSISSSTYMYSLPSLRLSEKALLPNFGPISFQCTLELS